MTTGPMSTGRALLLPDTAATEALGRALAAARPARGRLLLEGELGAGKSTLARALLRALGVRGSIRSPTYTLIERYPLADGGEAAHLDLYRLGDAAELDFLGLDELEQAATLWLVEWPCRGGGRLPAADLRLQLAVHPQGREARLEALSPAGAGWIAGLQRPG